MVPFPNPLPVLNLYSPMKPTGKGHLHTRLTRCVGNHRQGGECRSLLYWDEIGDGPSHPTGHTSEFGSRRVERL